MPPEAALDLMVEPMGSGLGQRLLGRVQQMLLDASLDCAATA